MSQYEFIGTWDEQYKRVGFEADFEGTPIERLIRCKDCRHYRHYDEQYGYCMKDGCYGWYDDDFCSRAERKEE